MNYGGVWWRLGTHLCLLTCLTPAWNASVLAGSHGLCHCLQGLLSPPWSQQPQSLLAALHPLLPALNALSTPGWPMVPQPCSVSAPPETMSPLLTALPLMCHSAGRPAASSHGPCSLNLLLEGQCSEAQREEEDSPAQQTAVLTCPLLPATPSLPRSGVEPSQQLPFIRPAATSCNQK